MLPAIIILYSAMQKPHFIKLFTFLALICLPVTLWAQEATVINKLNNFIRPINTLNPDSSFSDINFLGETLKERDIISLGEVTHGTKEVYVYKDRLIRYLVSNLNYKAIAFEADYSGLENIDSYITGKTDSAAMSPNYRALFMWLREFNNSQSENDKVRVYGLEIREFSTAIDNILRQNEQIAPNDKQVLLRIKSMQFNKIDKASLKDFRIVCSRMSKNRYSNMLLQLIDNYDNYISLNSKIGARDKFMAENAIAIKEGTENKKLIIWAHNGHVAKTTLYGRPTMGEYLHNEYTDKYYVMATDMNKGHVRVRKFIAKNKPISNWESLYYPEVNSIKAYEYYFKQCKFKNFILDFNEAKKDHELNSFLTQDKEMRLIGALSIPVNKKLSLANNFDMIIFFNETNSI
jgi:erythromycin esterase-like protein